MTKKMLNHSDVFYDLFANTLSPESVPNVPIKSNEYINRSLAKKQQYADPVWKKKRDATVKKAQNRPEVKAKIRNSLSITLATTDLAERISAKVKERHADQEFKKQFKQACKAAQNRPEVKDKVSKSLSITLATTDLAKKRAETRKKNLENPEVRARIRKAPPAEQKPIYKQALEHGPMPNRFGKVTWLETARKFGLNVDKLAMYGRGEHLHDLE